jgi:hypothetical protein
LRVLSGKLRYRSIRITAPSTKANIRVGEKEYPHSARASGTSTLFTLEETIVLAAGDELRIEAMG